MVYAKVWLENNLRCGKLSIVKYDRFVMKTTESEADARITTRNESYEIL